MAVRVQARLEHLRRGLAAPVHGGGNPKELLRGVLQPGQRQLFAKLFGVLFVRLEGLTNGAIVR